MQYALIFAGFLVVYFLVQKFNTSGVNRAVKKVEDDTSFDELATALGCRSEKVELGETGKKTIFNYGKKVTGEYRKHPIEIMSAAKTNHYAQGLDTGYSYSRQSYIKLAVPTPPEAGFTIAPPNKAIQTVPTGVPEFDGVLTITGNVRLSPRLLQALAAYGWTNLRLKEQEITFDDTYYDGASNTMNFARSKSLMNNPHPVWGSTLTSNTIDPVQTKAFIDLMVDIATEVGALR